MITHKYGDVIYTLLNSLCIATLLQVSTPCQSVPSLLLPSAVTFGGIVVDPMGQPIPNVRIDHLTVGSDYKISDSAGRFRIETSAPAVVFRKEGLKSRLIRTAQAGMAMRLVMEPANSPKRLPNCPSENKYVSLGLGLFALPKIKEVHVGGLDREIDAAQRSFVIKRKAGFKKLVHGSGPSWGGPIPRSIDVWVSESFAEEFLDAQGFPTLDARGRTADGKLWRNVGQEGESVFYYGVDEIEAILFDKLLDGLCIRYSVAHGSR